MLVLPLGLGTKLRRIPLVTILVAVAWLAVYASDRSDERIASGLVASVGRTGVRDATRQLFVEYCTGHKGSNAQCQKYAQLIWTGFPAKGDKDFVTRSLQTRASMEIGGLAGGGLPSELKQAEALRAELRDCGPSKKCFHYKEMIWSFLGDHLDDPAAAASVAKLPSYEDYRTAQSGYLSVLQKLCSANDCLMRGQINAKSLILAQLRHGGVFHLLANLIALLLFGVYVEQRGNRAVYFGTALICGTIGMALYTSFVAADDTIVIGGSAIVSAVMGMFYVFFFHSKMRFLVWLPRKVYTGTRFAADVRYCFPLFFLLSDVVGGLDTGFAELVTHKVAHGAHLIGFTSGALAAYLIGLWRVVPSPLVFEGEADMIKDLQQTRSLPRILTESSRLLSWNPENIAVREVACAAALKSSILMVRTAPRPLRLQAHEFLKEHLTPVCAVNAREGGYRFICQLLVRIPAWMPMGAYLERLGSVNILKVADFALAQAHMLLAVRLYDLYLMRFPLSLKARVVEASAADAVARLPPNRETVVQVDAYLRSHAHSLLAPRLGAWLTNNDRRAA